MSKKMIDEIAVEDLGVFKELIAGLPEDMRIEVGKKFLYYQTVATMACMVIEHYENAIKKVLDNETRLAIRCDVYHNILEITSYSGGMDFLGAILSATDMEHFEDEDSEDDT